MKLSHDLKESGIWLKSVMIDGKQRKTRIKYYGGCYYPQVRSFLFWRYTAHNKNIAWFHSEDAAKKFLETDFLYNGKIIWTGEI